MSKADVSTTPIRSRRAFLAGIAVTAVMPIAAAVPAGAAAVMPNAAATLPHVVDPVIALAERAIAAWNDFEAKCSVTSKAEDTVIDWRNFLRETLCQGDILLNLEEG